MRIVYSVHSTESCPKHVRNGACRYASLSICKLCWCFPTAGHSTPRRNRNLHFPCRLTSSKIHTKMRVSTLFSLLALVYAVYAVLRGHSEASMPTPPHFVLMTFPLGNSALSRGHEPAFLPWCKSELLPIYYDRRLRLAAPAMLSSSYLSSKALRVALK